ncbi:hypothetical protein ACIA8C_01545 [Nocardia sp. NPDC051321]|uniref:hypothetical protein n=1 Tax=Nocardia sp. NPDC051321 TaxID=3364323 RepID=UPI003799A751
MKELLVHKYSALVAAVAVGTLVTGCGSDKATEKDWRSIDACALVEPEQVSKIDYSRPNHPEPPTPKRADDQDGVRCKWNSDVLPVLSISIYDFPDRDVVNSTPPPAWATPVRELDIDGRKAKVSEEKGGRCSLWIVFRDANMDILIDPDSGKTTIDSEDRSHASCDAQLPLLKSILAKANLP